MQLFGDQRLEILRRDDPDMFQVDETAEAVEGLLYHRTATAHDVEKLLGTLGCGHWPKATTDAACHDYKMVCHISSCSKNIVCR